MQSAVIFTVSFVIKRSRSYYEFLIALLLFDFVLSSVAAVVNLCRETIHAKGKQVFCVSLLLCEMGISVFTVYTVVAVTPQIQLCLENTSVQGLQMIYDLSDTTIAVGVAKQHYFFLV